MNSVNSDIFRKAGALLTKQKAFAAVVLMMFFMVFPRTNFYSVNNLSNLVEAVSVLMILAYGVTLVLVAGGCDLSIGGVLVVSGIVAIMIINAGLPIWLGVIGAMLSGCVVGVINGFISVYQRTEPFIITLGMGMVLKGVAQQLTNAHPMPCTNPAFQLLSNGTVFGVIPWLVIVMIIVFIIMHVILRYTPYGRNCYAIGGDYEVAKSSGINVRLIKASTYVVCGATAGLGGAMLSSLLNTGSSIYGDTTALLVNCGVVVGGTSFAGGIGSAPQSLIGLLVFGVLSNAMNMLSINSYIQQLVQGVLIVLIISLDCYSRKRKREAV